MGAKKIKISKKEVQKALKAEELAKVPVLSKEWIEERSTRILTGLGILVLLVGAFGGSTPTVFPRTSRPAWNIPMLCRPGRENRLRTRRPGSR